MKILLSLGKRPWPARSRSGRAVSVGDFRPPERATPSAREKEDRSDIGGADHHGMHNLSRARQRSTGHDGAVYWSGADVSGRPVRFSITMGWLHLRDSQSQRRLWVERQLRNGQLNRPITLWTIGTNPNARARFAHSLCTLDGRRLLAVQAGRFYRLVCDLRQKRCTQSVCRSSRLAVNVPAHASFLRQEIPFFQILICKHRPQ
jgi:hypothetical protein